MIKKKKNDITMMEKYAQLCTWCGTIDASLYKKYNVNRGLRDITGKGVLAGLTKISLIESKKENEDGTVTPIDGRLLYRGIDIHDLVNGFVKDGRFGFEETAYFLLFGALPNREQLKEFEGILAQNRTLPTNFTRDVIMKAPSKDMMTSLSKSILTLASYDNDTDDLSLPNVLAQCIMLISVFPMLAVYGYHAYNHYERGNSFYIHYPDPKIKVTRNSRRRSWTSRSSSIWSTEGAIIRRLRRMWYPARVQTHIRP